MGCPLGKTLKVKLLVGPHVISHQLKGSCLGIRQIPKMCHEVLRIIPYL